MIPPLTYQGQPLAMDHVGLMTDCTPLLDDVTALQSHLDEKGYVYLPGYLERSRVVESRRAMIAALNDKGIFEPGTDPMDGIVAQPPKPVDWSGGRLDRIFADWRKIHDVLYTGRMIEFFEAFLSSPVRHYDYTWVRQIRPGVGTRFHSDVVYMGRGTHRLYTAWTPMGDNDFSLGGLLMLEGSNHHAGLAKEYWQSDVDAYCQNKEDKRDGWQKSGGGWLKGAAEQIRQSLGYDRWVTADFRMGDVVIFHIYTLHGSTDNVSNRIRLSTDTRYQPANLSVDERWIGAEPVAHGPAAKQGVIC